MTRRALTDEDLALFIELDHAARATQVIPYLIGAGAIQLGPARHWESRPRMTRDWDFAVRVGTWEQFQALTEQLVAAGLSRASELHRLFHSNGRILDIVPFGNIASPDGEVQWSDGTTMDTGGLHVLEDHHETRRLGNRVDLRIATLPALVGLKMLAYVVRRPGTTRDIADAYRMLVEVESTFDNARLDEAAWDRIRTGSPTLHEMGVYFVGRDLGGALSEAEGSTVKDLCLEAESEDSLTIPDVMRSADAHALSRRAVLLRLRALLAGIEDAKELT